MRVLILIRKLRLWEGERLPRFTLPGGSEAGMGPRRLPTTAHGPGLCGWQGPGGSLFTRDLSTRRWLPLQSLGGVTVPFLAQHIQAVSLGHREVCPEQAAASPMCSLPTQEELVLGESGPWDA